MPTTELRDAARLPTMAAQAEASEVIAEGHPN
jgi:hypothetical protein